MGGHVWEFLVLNENCGLLRQGEGGSEALHKVERQNRQYGSRKTSIAAGNDDMFRLAFVQSDPGIRSLDRKPFCSVCRNDNHFTRGCKVRFPGPSGREDDVLVSGFLTTREEEPTEQINL